MLCIPFPAEATTGADVSRVGTREYGVASHEHARRHHAATGLGARSGSSRTSSPSASASASPLFTVISGIVPLITEWHNDNAIHREVFDNIPGPLQVAFYTVIPVMLVWGAFQFADRMKNWERGAPGPPPHHAEERQAPPRRLPRRRLHADPAARLGRRPDALDDLLRVPRAARRHHGARDRPPAARGASSSSTAAPTRRTRSSATSPASCSSVGIVWAIVRRYVQRPYRIRIKTKPEHARHPRHVPRHRRHRLRRRGVPHRARAAQPTLREVELRRLPAQPAVRRLSAATRSRRWHQIVVDRPRASRSSCSWRSCRSRCCATCSRRR